MPADTYGTPIAGCGGSITTTTATIGVRVTEWSATLETDPIEVPPAFGSRMKTVLLGAGSVKGSLRGTLHKDVGGVKPFPDITAVTGWEAGFSGALVLQADTGCTMTLAAVTFTRIDIRVGNGRESEITADFQSNGQTVAFTWDVA